MFPGLPILWCRFHVTQAWVLHVKQAGEAAIYDRLDRIMHQNAGPLATEEQRRAMFAEAMAGLRQDFGASHPKIVTYIEKEWATHPGKHLCGLSACPLWWWAAAVHYSRPMYRC